MSRKKVRKKMLEDNNKGFNNNISAKEKFLGSEEPKEFQLTDLDKKETEIIALPPEVTEYCENDVQAIEEFVGKILASNATDIQKPEWIRVTDHLPKDNREYATITSTGEKYINRFYPQDKVWKYKNSTVIGWFPLPDDISLE